MVGVAWQTPFLSRIVSGLAVLGWIVGDALLGKVTWLVDTAQIAVEVSPKLAIDVFSVVAV
jgi:F420-0:gamma-glutamyl ligase-like protein